MSTALAVGMVVVLALIFAFALVSIRHDVKRHGQPREWFHRDGGQP